LEAAAATGCDAEGAEVGDAVSCGVGSAVEEGSAVVEGRAEGCAEGALVDGDEDEGD